MDQFNPENFRFKSGNPSQRKRRDLPRHKKGEKFLAGPIPWSWLVVAARLPGRSIHVALALWFLANVKNSIEISLSGKLLRELGVNRKAGYRGLRALERAKLVSCIRSPGCCPMVMILEFPIVVNGNGKESGMVGGK